MFTLLRKLLRDIRVPLAAITIVLAAFECLWVKVTARITAELVPFFFGMAAAQKLSPIHVEEEIFKGPGQILKTLMGGEGIKLSQAMDILSIGFVEPLVLAVFCIWAIGRAAGAIAGEIDRGTMELLLAEPVPRRRVVLAHLAVDVLVIPLICLSLWLGLWVGTEVVGPFQVSAEDVARYPFKLAIDPAALEVHPARFGYGLPNVAALIFAVSGYTMWLSSAGRFRGRVLGLAVMITLLQFLVNLFGQLWDGLAPLRPFTVFYWYQPQQIILGQHWSMDLGIVWNGGQPLLAVPVLAVLFGVGAVGYTMALWTFCRRDLPAPL